MIKKSIFLIGSIIILVTSNIVVTKIQGLEEEIANTEVIINQLTEDLEVKTLDLLEANEKIETGVSIEIGDNHMSVAFGETVKVFEHTLSGVGLQGLHSYKLHVYEVYNDSLNATIVDRINIYNENNELIQTIDGFKTDTYIDKSFDYGFSVNDWNFDGYADISILQYHGGTALNAPTLYWLWDEEKSEYVYNEALTDLSQGTYVTVDEETKEIIASYRYILHNPTTYIWKNDDLVPVRREFHEYEEEYEMPTIYKIEEIFNNGEWIETKRSIVDLKG